MHSVERALLFLVGHATRVRSGVSKSYSLVVKRKMKDVRNILITSAIAETLFEKRREEKRREEKRREEKRVIRHVTNWKSGFPKRSNRGGARFIRP
ncbi:MAG: hypothetical protein EOP06_12205 [Proteobacteria bacterium]|nr:MAG: hypothetical protein EOP06_12205 [Pseudomonadota bacterium]